MSGVKHTEEWKKNMSIRRMGHPVSQETRDRIRKAVTGYKHTDATKLKMSIDRTGRKLSEEHKRKIGLASKHRVLDGTWKNQFGGYKEGVSSRDIHSLYNPKYVEWRTLVFERDNYTCRIADINCKGQLQAHHILPWRDYVELRYVINNGITLCLAHHPRKRSEEKRLSPYFQELVSVSKVPQFQE